MRVKLPRVLTGVFVLGVAVPAFGHHSFGVQFDATKCMDLGGPSWVSNGRIRTRLLM